MPEWTMTKETPHAYRVGADYNVRGNPAHQPVLWIEYRRTRAGLVVPFSILTPWDTWDVDYCESDGECYFHVSGSGPGLPSRQWCGGEMRNGRAGEAHRTDRKGSGVQFYGTVDIHPWRITKWQQRKDPECLWYERQAVVITTDQGTRARHPDAYLRRSGYDVLDAPAVAGGCANPFETDWFRHNEESETVYCSVCNDRFPEYLCNEICPHVWWCDECSVYVGPGTDEHCKHEDKTDD
jgi:hypothetical protein